VKFIVDECTGPAVARWLLSQGHEVISVFEDYRGMDDDEIIEKALVEDSLLTTKILEKRCSKRGRCTMESFSCVFLTRDLLSKLKCSNN
jgi:hypothetical protein